MASDASTSKFYKNMFKNNNTQKIVYKQYINCVKSLLKMASDI